MKVRLNNELLEMEKSCLSQIHPSIMLEAILHATPCVQFRSRLPNGILVELRFIDDEVEVSFPYLAVDSVWLKIWDVRTITFIKLKDAFCSINAPHRRLLKIHGSFLSYLRSWRQAPPYLKSVDVKVHCAHRYGFKSDSVFEVQGTRLTSLADVVRQTELQWYVYLFDKCYGDRFAVRWKEFCTHYHQYRC